ncbi:MAG: nuclear transport factor 2 family protein [Chthoniobacterales bacterium]|nr:nuclear transport factor 2 family protein [Chthoniobacterales bacterium]
MNKLPHRLFTWFVMLLVAAASQVPAANAQDTDLAAIEIRSVLDAQADAWNRGDIDSYMNGYARGNATEFLGADNLTRGWQTVRDRYAKKYDSTEKMGNLTFSEIDVKQLGADAALVIGRWQLKRIDDVPHGWFTLIFRKLPEGWRIVHDHTSSASP